jgi:hypothetical protein
MKNPDRKTVAKLTDLPNIGKAMAGDFQVLGIDHPKQLIGQDPFDLYNKLCKKTKTKHDPCVIDVFMAAIDFMEGGEAKPWWDFTEERKRRLTGE